VIKILLASGNRHKYEEFADFFSRLSLDLRDNFELIPASNYPNIGSIEENGSSYEENSFIKAGAWADFSGIPAIADDSGLEVRALDWEPGIYSARACTGDDGDRIAWLLSRLAGKTDRRARFVACVVIAFPGGRASGEFFASRGTCWGNIADNPAGGDGFGYDPVFVPDGFGSTFAEMGREEKSKISHRSAALRGVARMARSVIKYYTVRHG
jgi:XTP/dITP diphosphohydrolase